MKRNTADGVLRPPKRCAGCGVDLADDEFRTCWDCYYEDVANQTDDEFFPDDDPAAVREVPDERVRPPPQGPQS